MQTMITAKLKLNTTPEQCAALRQLQLAYRDALNQASQYAFAHGKTSNRQRLHQALYDEVRATHGLPSQMTCSVFRQVGATYKGLWTKWYKNVEARKAGHSLHTQLVSRLLSDASAWEVTTADGASHALESDPHVAASFTAAD